jgi:hypothetical protein
MRTFKFNKDYYDERNIYKKSKIEINTGITVLVGCNGSGKSTLQLIMKDDLEKNKIEYLEYDNLKNGDHSVMQELAFKNDFARLSAKMAMSEGENIRDNICSIAENIGKYMRTGENPANGFSRKIANLLRDKDEDDDLIEESDERWLFFDALDSGYSIDNILEFKELLHLILDDFNKSLKIYIIVTANEYEMCVDEPCFDVVEGKYIDINSYEDFRETILKSRKYKDEQLDLYYREEED